MAKIFILACAFISVAMFCQADVINVPSDYTTIQEGINASVSGDTVLVQPGIYIENVNFNSKNITLGSLFLTTHDTSYISQTVIDGDSSGSVVTFASGEDSTAILTGFTITNGYNMYKGAGIYIAGSDPIIKDVLITENNADYGGGVSCSFSHSTLINCVIDNNYCEKYGGGIYSFGNSINLLNVKLTNNTSTNDNLLSYGGGIFFMFDSTSVLENVTISGNKSAYGGGVCVCFSSNPSFKNVTIKENKATSVGGGIFCNDSSYIVFDDVDRCNILMNNLNARSNGADIATESAIQVIVDTFTVLNPTDYHAFPIDSINFDILHGKLDQVEADLYVAPWGDNNNSGLSPDQPLKTIQFACAIIIADSLHPHTINLASGTYSTSTNGEFFPISLPNYVTLKGDSTGTILDAEETARVLRLYKVDAALENLIIKNGYACDGAGIYCFNCEIYGSNLKILNNVSIDDGGGICSIDSNINLNKTLISGNEALNPTFGGGGIYLSRYSILRVNQTTITNNYAEQNAGGIYTKSIFDCSINNSIVSNNNKYGIYAHWSSRDIDISYSDFWDNEEGNFYGLNDSIGNNVTVNANGDSCDAFYNIQMDPMFVDPANLNYHLQWGSPCIDAGDPNSPLDPDSTVADMGAYYYDQSVGIAPGQEDHMLELGNYPNPFSRSTTIYFSIPVACHVTLQIYNIKGQLVEEILNDELVELSKTMEWNAEDYPSGVYLYKLVTSESSIIKKMVLMKHEK